MKLISVNVGLPRLVDWQGKVIRTSIWKQPVDERIRVSRLNLEGDRQSDVSVHGGADKAVYVYPSEHYSYWRSTLPVADLPWGAFGENFTAEGLLEDRVRVGDRFRVGSSEFIVTQPRMPCFKLGIRFNRADMVRRFLRSKRTGFYLAVVREGEVGPDEPIYRGASQEDSLTITDIVKLYRVDSANLQFLRRASELAALPEGWKGYFRKRLQEANLQR